VSLLENEEFHVTDQLLKLPFQSAAPQTVCIFSVATGALAFRLVDPDRRSTVNGVEKREATISVGDRIQIGENLSIEVLVAPEIARASPVRTALTESPTIPNLDMEEGPTLTQTATLHTAKPSPIFSGVGDKSLEIDEPSFRTGTPVAKPVAPPMMATPMAVEPPRHSPGVSGGRPSLIPEMKVELANVPHAVKDTSLDKKEDLDEVDLSHRKTLGERVRDVVTGFIPRKNTADKGPSPWLTSDRVDPGITTMKSATYGAKPEKTPKSAQSAPVPWIPQAISSAARLRGRALIFLVAAIGTLMIAVGVFRIQSRVAELEESRKPSVAPLPELSRGIPIELLEDKVRRMRRPR